MDFYKFLWISIDFLLISMDVHRSPEISLGFHRISINFIWISLISYGFPQKTTCAKSDLLPHPILDCEHCELLAQTGHVAMEGGPFESAPLIGCGETICYGPDIGW